MTNKEDGCDEALKALWEQLAKPHLRDLLRREQDDAFKFDRDNVALEKWGTLIQAEMEAELARQQARRDTRLSLVNQ